MNVIQHRPSVAKRIFQLRIELLGVTPAVWRRIWVPEAVRLKKLDRVIQEAMGWTNRHAHLFLIDGQRFGVPNGWNHDERLLDERRVCVDKVLSQPGLQFRYLYDLEDRWEHSVLVERIDTATTLNKRILCVAGENACPPEEVGGTTGYTQFCAALCDPSHPEFTHYWNWNEGPFDPTAFDLNRTNRRLRKLP